MKILRKCFSSSNEKIKQTEKDLLAAGTAVGLGAGAIGTKLAEKRVLDEIATKPIKHAAKIARIKHDSEELAANILGDRVSLNELNEIGKKVKSEWYIYGRKRHPGDTASRVIKEANSKIKKETIDLPEKLANLGNTAKSLNRATKVLGAAAIGAAGYGAYKHYRNKKKDSNKKGKE